MPTARNSDEGLSARVDSALRRFGLTLVTGRIAVTVFAGFAVAGSACKEKSSQIVAEAAKEAEPSTELPTEPRPSPSAKRENRKSSREGDAVWYDVPENSLAKRRAGKGELTAAHNRLPLGTRVRVTHLANGKTVIVRITDRGITNRASIDLCKEAAEELGMVREGRVRVRMEVLLDDKGVDAVPDSTGTAAHP